MMTEVSTTISIPVQLYNTTPAVSTWPADSEASTRARPTNISAGSQRTIEDERPLPQGQDALCR